MGGGNEDGGCEVDPDGGHGCCESHCPQFPSEFGDGSGGIASGECFVRHVLVSSNLPIQSPGERILSEYSGGFVIKPIAIRSSKASSHFFVHHLV